MKPTIANLVERAHDGKLPAYAWPGGYPIVYLDGNNETLCPDCAQEALDDPDEFDEWKPEAWFVHYEGSSCFCRECNKEMESAYGDPDEEDA